MFENPKKVTSKDLSESSIDHLYTSLQNSLSTKKPLKKGFPLSSGFYSLANYQIIKLSKINRIKLYIPYKSVFHWLHP